LGHLRARGKIIWRGQPLRRWRRRELARLVAYLPQSPVYEPQQTVADVLRLGRAPYWRAFGIESRRDGEVVAEVAALLDLNDLLERPVEEISGGQRQRVFLGRCLVQEPAAMLLDEPNTFLDLRHQVELLGLLRKISRERGIGVLLASHDLNLAATFADRMLLLDGGVIVAAGDSTAVLRPDLLEKVYGIPMECIERPSGGAAVVIPLVG
ncbi:MAG TPA: ABC transporter ATP-binding protein, partial [Tepidisphaeraceae bacterium]